MDLLFGDATTAMPTPATQAERGSLIGANSPVPSLDLPRHHGQFGAESAIPGLDIEPPTINADNGSKVGGRVSQNDGDSRSEGLGGWISNMLRRNKGSASAKAGSSSQYRPLDQEEEE
jgi:hypothetical protein